MQRWKIVLLTPEGVELEYSFTQERFVEEDEGSRFKSFGLAQGLLHEAGQVQKELGLEGTLSVQQTLELAIA